MPYFYTANSSIKAPKTDISILNTIESCKINQMELFTAIENKIINHLWYLTPENVMFALFDSRVSEDTKNKMRINIMQNKSSGTRVHKLDINKSDLPNISLENLCNLDSLNFFKILNLSHAFLHIDACNWETDKSFNIAKRACYSIISTNDLAERGVKVAEEYNGVLTKKKQQYQKICMLCYHMRKTYKKSK